MREITTYIRICIALIFCLTLVPAQSHAQGYSGLGGLDRALYVDTIPKYPGPNEEVTVRITSYDINLQSSEITWRVNGAVVDQGIGKRTLKIMTGDIGQPSNITVGVGAPGIQGFSRSLSIIPAKVDLIWEARTYTPHFYKGKALFSRQSDYVIEAFPFVLNGSGTRIPRENLIYNWSKDGKIIPGSSGYGRYTLSTSGERFGTEEEVTVTITTVDESVQLQKSVVIEHSDPMLLVYEVNPLYGTLWSRALGNTYNLTQREMSLEVAPFFIGYTQKINPSINYVWKLNGQNIPQTQDPTNLVFRLGEETAGRSQIEVTAQDTERVIGNLRKTLTVEFDQ